MKGRLLIGLFVCMAAAQVATPLSMILKREAILKEGIPFKFKTAPVDPYDAFRGRYVALRMDQDTVPVPQGHPLGRGQTVYALISIGEDGFAVLTTVLEKRPLMVPYLQAEVRAVVGDTVHLDLPVDRYYMEEKAAPVAERIYRRRTAGDQREAFVLVRVKDGLAVVESLYVGGVPIEEAVKEEIKEAPGR